MERAIPTCYQRRLPSDSELALFFQFCTLQDTLILGENYSETRLSTTEPRYATDLVSLLNNTQTDSSCNTTTLPSLSFQRVTFVHSAIFELPHSFETSIDFSPPTCHLPSTAVSACVLAKQKGEPQHTIWLPLHHPTHRRSLPPTLTIKSCTSHTIVCNHLSDPFGIATLRWRLIVYFCLPCIVFRNC